MTKAGRQSKAEKDFRPPREGFGDDIPEASEEHEDDEFLAGVSLSP